MDVPEGCLMGAHGYCTQEMVNLLMNGIACSNVFDGDKVLGSGSDQVIAWLSFVSSDSRQTVLKGVKSQSELGFLSLFEHYGSCEVCHDMSVRC